MCTRASNIFFLEVILILKTLGNVIHISIVLTNLIDNSSIHKKFAIIKTRNFAEMTPLFLSALY